MEDHNQHIDQYFRQQLGGYTEQPTPDVWAALEQRLDEKPRRRRVLWVWFVLLFMGAAGGTVFYTLSSVIKPNPSPARNVVTPAVPLPHTPATQPVLTRIKPAKPSTSRLTSTQEPKTETPAKSATNTQFSAPRVATRKLTVKQEPIEEVPITTNLSGALDAEAKPEHTRPAETDAPKPVAKQEILHLSPATNKAEKSAQPEQQPNEDAFQALVPMAGPNKALAKASAPSAPMSTPNTPSVQPAAPVDDIKEVAPADGPGSLITDSVKPLASEETETLQPEKKGIRKFSVGLKTGYEFGTKPYHANSFVLSPYLQYNLGKRFGLLLQPALKYAHSSAAVLSYGGYTQTTDSMKERIITLPTTGRIPTGNDETMAYQKTYDSVFIRNELKDVRYWNLDLPLMLSYKVSKNFSIYAGPAFHFTRVPKVVTTQQKFSDIVLDDTLRMERKPMSIEFDTMNIDEVFPRRSFDISQYDSSAFDNPEINPFKMGVTFGLSYTFRKRFHFDIVYRQTLSKMEYIQNAKVREILSQPYIRVILGFDLLK